MNIHKDSHVDHGLSERQLSYILERFGDHRAPFTTTIELPAEYGTVPCGLIGPLVGDAPVTDDEVNMIRRGGRAWLSRCYAKFTYPRTSRLVTVIAGEHDGQPCVLFTAFGGPIAPQEPDDPNCADVEASRAFWRDHALLVPPLAG